MALKHALCAVALGISGFAVSAANAGNSAPFIPPPTWNETGDAGGSTGSAQSLLGGGTLYHSITGFVGGGIGPSPTVVPGDTADTFKFHWDGGAALRGFFDCK